MWTVQGGKNVLFIAREWAAFVTLLQPEILFFLCFAKKIEAASWSWISRLLIFCTWSSACGCDTEIKNQQASRNWSHSTFSPLNNRPHLIRGRSLSWFMNERDSICFSPCDLIGPHLYTAHKNVLRATRFAFELSKSSRKHFSGVYFICVSAGQLQWETLKWKFIIACKCVC